ncbi:MAG: NAD(P)-binding domain-containing protein [Gaiellales bacterium]
MSESIPFLTRLEVAERLPPIPAQIDIAEHTYRSMAAGRVELPPKIGIHPRPDSFIHAMPAYLADTDVAAIKWVAGYPGNEAQGLPYISGLIVVNDAGTGVPRAVMDAAEITAARTAAASGACVRAFAPEGWSRVAILGCGEQGRYHAAVLRSLHPGAEIRAYDRHPERAAAVAERAMACGSPREAVEGAEVVVTAAAIVRQPDPPIAPDWVGARCLLLPIDFDALVQPATVAASGLFVSDDVDQFEYYRGQGHFQGWPRPSAGVGQALEAGSRADLTVCANLGVGALDAAFAQAVLGG